jgi:hypothetical protein
LVLVVHGWTGTTVAVWLPIENDMRCDVPKDSDLTGAAHVVRAWPGIAGGIPVVRSRAESGRKNLVHDVQKYRPISMSSRRHPRLEVFLQRRVRGMVLVREIQVRPFAC